MFLSTFRGGVSLQRVREQNRKSNKLFAPTLHGLVSLLLGTMPLMWNVCKWELKFSHTKTESYLIKLQIAKDNLTQITSSTLPPPHSSFLDVVDFSPLFSCLVLYWYAKRKWGLTVIFFLTNETLARQHQLKNWVNHKGDYVEK